MAPRAATRWKFWVRCTGGILVALALALIALNTTSLPLRLARQFAEVFEARTGLQIELSGARFVGLTHLRLDGVTFSSTEGVLAQGEVAEVHLRFSPLEALGVERGEGRLGSVDLVRPRLYLRESGLGAVDSLGRPSPSSPGADSRHPSSRRDGAIDVRVIDGLIAGEGFDGESWRVEGRFTLGQGPGLLGVEEVRLREEGRGVALEVSSDRDEALLRWRATGPAETIVQYLPGFPWSLSGEMEAEGTAALSGALKEVALTVSRGVIGWGSDPAHDQTPFDRIEMAMVRESDWNLRSLVMTRGEATVRAEGSVRPPDPVNGEGGSLELQVFSDGLDLPAGIALLERYGFSGRSRFTGVLSGSFDELELAGRLTLEKGSVWHRPVDRAEGIIQLGHGFIRFGDAELVEGEAEYEVSGEIAYGESPARFQVALEASNGRVEEVLAAAGVEVEATGRFDGALLFTRSEEGIAVEGNVVRASGELMGQPLDDLAGSFRWSAEGLRLAHARAGLQGGVVTLAGEARGDELDIAVGLDRWPLEMGESPLLDLPDGVSGWISYAGRLTGTLSAPVLDGELRGGSLSYGRLRLVDPKGRLVITESEAHLEDVQVSGAGDGVYRLSGTIGDWRGEVPQLDLAIDVVTASLSGLFLEGGLEVPALLLDGDVTGEVTLSGSAKAPKATFDLALGDDLGVAEPIRLRFNVEDGKLRLGRSALASLLAR